MGGREVGDPLAGSSMFSLRLLRLRDFKQERYMIIYLKIGKYSRYGKWY